MAYRNGEIPNSALAAIPGGKLRKDAARHWNAMYKEIKEKTGTEIRPSGPRSSYRTLFGQKYFWSLYQSGQGNLAAYPGTSNHGWGLAVDVATTEMASLINKYGAKYGWQKVWSDAQSEWWHFKWKEGDYGVPVGDPVIRRGSRGLAVKKLQVYLRRAGYLPKMWHVHTKYTFFVRRAVRRFQKAHGLPVDGVVGPKTWKKLRAATK